MLRAQIAKIATRRMSTSRQSRPQAARWVSRSAAAVLKLEIATPNNRGDSRGMRDTAVSPCSGGRIATHAWSRRQQTIGRMLSGVGGQDTVQVLVLIAADNPTPNTSFDVLFWGFDEVFDASFEVLLARNLHTDGACGLTP